MDYVSHVLPILGEESVDQRAVAELVDGIEVTRADRPDVERLKADLRLAEVVRRAVELRLEPRAGSFEARLDGAYVRVREERSSRCWPRSRSELGLGSAARERFRMELLRSLYGQYTAKLGARAFAAADEVERALRKAGLTRFIDRVWPVVKPDDARLPAARQPDAAAGGGRRAARRATSSGCSPAAAAAGRAPTCRSWTGSLAARGAASGLRARDRRRGAGPDADGARMVARRMRGAFTLLGDIAQATGPVPYAAGTS